MDIYSGDLYKLKKPVFLKTFGQGPEPSGITITKDGKTYFLDYDNIYKASASCDPEYKIANLESSPYPLVRIEILEEIKDQLLTIGE